jgi:hypothetical protein
MIRTHSLRRSARPVSPTPSHAHLGTVGELRGLESHGVLIGEEYNRFETMVIEARKP